MVRGKILLIVGSIMVLTLVSAAQMEGPREGGPPPAVVMPAPPPLPVGPGPIPLMRMREYAEQLRASAREAQELADRLRRQADELDMMTRQMMDRGRSQEQRGQMERELAEIKEAIGRAEREGRWQEVDELRRQADRLLGRFGPMPPGPGPEERGEMKRQIERLRDESRQAKEEGRMEDAKHLWQEADRLERKLRESGPREERGPGRPLPPEIDELRRAAEQAERDGRMDEARRMREKAESIEREFETRNEPQGGPRGPREEQRQEMKRQIERLRDEAGSARQKGRFDDANRIGQEADRLEQQLRGEDPGQSGPGLKEGLIRSMEEIKKEIGRLWQTVNEMRSRLKEGRPV